MCKISVIVPVYNVFDYIDRCLNSLVNQTFSDFEIIIVNDGSKDNSESIIKEYMSKYDFIKYYKKDNGGLSSARNYGFKYAKGEYILFIDSDDYVDVTMLHEMYNVASVENSDIVMCSLDYVNEDGSKLHDVIMPNKSYQTRDEIKKFMISMYPTVWNKLYRRDLIKTFKFKENIWYEDVEFNYRLIPNIKKIAVCNKVLYHYVQRKNAISKTFDDRLYNYIDNFNGIIDFYKKNGNYDQYKKELEYSYVRYLYATFVWQATNYTDYLKYQDAVSKAILNVNKKFPNYRKNKYFYTSLKGIYLVLFNKSISKILYKIRNR